MCGIAAMIRGSGGGFSPEERARMGRALARLARRGPDGEGVTVAGGGRALLGHRRLAIQDLTDAAAQPMGTADGSLMMVYNGEIYNAAAVRRELETEGAALRTRSDTEVLLRGIERWGVERTLEAVRGMFAFVVVGREEVIAAVDHAGMKPLAWAFVDGMLACASECDALGELMAEKPSLDVESVRRVLSIGYCPAPWTMWRGVKKLGPGMMLRWRIGDAAGPRVERWWRAPERITEERGEFDETLAEVSREHLIGDVPAGMFLSAGLDSASIAMSMKRAGADMLAVRAFTLATGDASDEDGPARALAERMGMPWSRVEFGAGELIPAICEAAEAFDEPQGYTAVLTATRIARAMRAREPGIKVVLGGDGGDEALGGYAWHRDAATHPLSLGAFAGASAEDVREHARLADVVARPDVDDGERGRALLALGRLSYTHRYLVRTFGGFHPAEAAALCGTSAAEAMDGFASWLAPEDRSALAAIRRAQRLDVMGFCAGSILPKLDRACMSVGLELRSPFLDRRVLEAGLARPVEAQEGERGGSKPGLRRLLARGAEEGFVPREILERPKQGFSLRMPGAGDGFESLGAMIDGSRLIGDGVVRRDWARFVPREAEARRVRLFTLAMVAAWYERRSA